MAASSTATFPFQSCRLRSADGFNLRELTGAAGLKAQFLPSGALFALRHRETLINQLLPGPAEDGLFRLLVRSLDPSGNPSGWAPLAGPNLAFGFDGKTATWRRSGAVGILDCTVTFALHPDLTAWGWRIRVRNTGDASLRVDTLFAQDLGLADVNAVRNNEAYNSQYLDLLPLTDTRLGHVVLARQNQTMAGGRHPWLACACAGGAAAFCTDGTQFFGADHRFTGEPAAVRSRALPSRRLQYEFALAGLQSRPVELDAGATAEVAFVVRYTEDHPTASGADDLARLHELLPATWIGTDAVVSPASDGSVFTTAGWLHGESPTAADWEAWFPGPRRHEEHASDGRLLSFFHGGNTHVVALEKEKTAARPHGHVLRSGGGLWPQQDQFGFTCYAAGIFGAQSYLGNPGLARLLNVVRNHLGLTRATGQRIFLRKKHGWLQLGVPTAFALEPGRVRWCYRLADGLIEISAWCSARLPASFLDVKVVRGAPRELLVTHQLALGSNEFESEGEITVHPDGWIALRPVAESFLARHHAGAAFAIAAANPAGVAAAGGGELLGAGGSFEKGPYAVFRTPTATGAAFIMLGTLEGEGALSAAVAAARAEYNGAAPASAPPGAPLRLNRSGDASVARLDEVLPWFAHNAGIHFSAPHGLEQYSGGAWGVRDVCQGSVEWLLAAGEFATVRRILLDVFAQQYAEGPGGWPQWFMLPPYHFVQQPHSHGDVCFWPVKALCDYVEVANDPAFLSTIAGYTDCKNFTPAGPRESILAHCDRVVDLCEKRFVAGTALVDYGDGDWDDTLQPADPAMRTRMISTWTVALACQVFSQLSRVCRRTGEVSRAARLEALLERMQRDFSVHAVIGGVVAGFLVHEADGRFRPLLHPDDRITGIRYRLLPMTRAVLAGLFTNDDARSHAALIKRELLCPDGVRLMSEPATYRGGLERLFKRAETAANVGREIGLQYVHAHLRYAEALACLGDAEGLWTALQVVNPVGLSAVLPNAAPRQANVYFSSSDADFADRLEAADRWSELRDGKVAVRAGWRLYSSGPGIFLRAVRSHLLGVRESFDDLVFDPVLPRSLDGLAADLTVLGRHVRIVCRVRDTSFAPTAVRVNGHLLDTSRRDPNRYRTGGTRIPKAEIVPLLRADENRIEIIL